MKTRQKFWLVVFLLSGLATWLLVWQEHYWPCITTLLLASVSAWRTGWID